MKQNSVPNTKKIEFINKTATILNTERSDTDNKVPLT